MATVPFYGKDSVLAAYDSQGVAVWSIWEGKELMQVGEDRDDLESFLGMLSQNGSAGTYTLRVYRGVEADDVDTKTVHYRGFKFKLNAGTGAMGSTGKMGSISEMITAKIGAMLEEDINTLIENRLSGKGKEETWEGILMGILNDPEKLANTIGLVQKIIKPAAAPVIPLQQLAAVGSTAPAPQTAKQMSEAEMNAMADLIDRWEKADPEFLTKLEKLVRLAETNPFMYNAAAGQLAKL